MYTNLQRVEGTVRVSVACGSEIRTGYELEANRAIICLPAFAQMTIGVGPTLGEGTAVVGNDTAIGARFYAEFGDADRARHAFIAAAAAVVGIIAWVDAGLAAFNLPYRALILACSVLAGFSGRAHVAAGAAVARIRLRVDAYGMS